MEVTVMPFVIDALWTIPKGFIRGLEELEIGGRTKTIQITAVLRSARIQKRVLETWRDLLSLDSSKKTTS